MTRPHVVVINRWIGSSGEYHRYIDHEQVRVTYVTTQEGAQWLASQVEMASCLIQVCDLARSDAVADAIRHAAEVEGNVNAILALSEVDLLVAAAMRDRFGVPGMGLEKMVGLRDKLTMKQRVSSFGIGTPAYACCHDPHALEMLLDRVGFPVVLKPTRSFGSIGVTVASDRPSLEGFLMRVDRSTYECEEFVAAPLFHLDGLVRDGRLAFFVASRYINTPYAYACGSPLGAVAVDDALCHASLHNFAERVIQALELEASAFHLEVFVPNASEPIFLEIGARVGGGPICRLFRDVYGVDLLREHARVQLGRAPELPPGEVRSVAGYLCVPEPADTPCRVVGVRRVSPPVPTMYAEYAPATGDLLDGTNNYLNICAEFLFSGSSTAAVEKDIRTTMSEFELSCEPVAADPRA